jgi:hypothetical protein
MSDTADLGGLFFPERKKRLAENKGGNNNGTYLIAIPASQREHIRSESFRPSRYVSRLLKEGYGNMYGLYMSKRTTGCSLDRN